MKRFVSCLCLILVCSMILVVPAMAAENGNHRASDYFMSYSAYFDHAYGNQYEIWFSVTALRQMDELGVKTIRLKQSSDEVNWTTIATYSKDNYSQMVNKSGTVIHGGYVPCTCTSGYYYMAEIELYAKDGNSTATMTVWTTNLDLT